jgi:hypothetical protein
LGLVVAALSSFIATSSALAWGSCGRGPWTNFPPHTKDRTDSYSEPSVCTCSNGQSGLAIGSELRNGSVYAWAGPTNGGVGAELEAWYNGQRVFVPIMYNWSTAYTAATYYARTDGTFNPPSWATSGYEFTGRFRSVCITNLPSLAPPNSPWAW